VTVKKVPNLSDSVQARLHHHMLSPKHSFQELLQDDAMERFVYRLSKMPSRACVALKGTLMLRVRVVPLALVSKDVDFFGRTALGCASWHRRAPSRRPHCRRAQVGVLSGLQAPDVD
jgi:hypothetical protein